MSTPQPPLWADLIEGVESRILGRWRPEGPGPAALQAADRALARAHSRMLVALHGGVNVSQDTVSQLVAEAGEMLIAVVGVWPMSGTGTGDRAALVDQLRRRLTAHEDAVLCGEATYGVSSELAEEPAARMRRAISGMSGKPGFQGDVLSLTIAAVELASLLIRVAANASVGGRASEAPEARSADLTARLRSVIDGVTRRATGVERPAHPGGDVVAHHLAAGLRVRFSPAPRERPGAGPWGRPGEPDPLDGLREAWLGLATHEYVAVTALDRQLETPAYDRRLGDLPAVIGEGAANVICGGRLAARPEAFLHRRAWRHQTVALTYALEAYVAGLRRDASSLAQAQLIALTRLVRCVVAIVLTDLVGATPSGRERG